MRRILGLIASASLLNLTLVGRDLACTAHETDQHAAATTSVASHSEGSHQGHTPEPQPEPCKTPGLPACCQIVTSCAVTMAQVVEVDVPDAALDDAHAMAALSTMPRSSTLGPEPPPPKA